jgi:hypothetical protein
VAESESHFSLVVTIMSYLPGKSRCYHSRPVMATHFPPSGFVSLA